MMPSRPGTLCRGMNHEMQPGGCEMILVDRALDRREREGKPVRVAMVGAGFMGRGIALQIFTAVPGMKLVAIANRHLDAARRVYAEAGACAVEVVENVTSLEDAIASGQFAITENAKLVCQAEGVDAVL